MRTCTLIISLAVSLAISYPAKALMPTENLVVQGVPNPPDKLVDEANRYTEFRTATLCDWHPIKKEIIIATRFSDTSQLHHLNSPGSARTQLTFFKDSVSHAAYCPKDGRYLIFSKDVGGNENFQQYRFDLDSGKITCLTDGASRNTGGVFSKSGRLFAFESNQRNKKDMDIYVIDPLSPETPKQVFALSGGGYSVQDFSPAEDTLLVLEYISINESRLWLFDLRRGEKKLLLGNGDKGEAVSYSEAVFSPDGKGIYVCSDRNSEFLKLNYVDLATTRFHQLLPGLNWDAEKLSLSEDGKYLAFSANESGAAKLHLVNTASGKEMPLPELKLVGQIRSLKFHKNGHDLGFTMDSAKAPDDVFSIDIRSGELSRWTRSETGGVNTEGFKEASLIKWKSFDGKEISGYLTMPPDKFEGPRPVLVLIHGGPEGQSRPGFLGRLNYYLNELGVAILLPNVRGSSGFGKTFLQLDNGLKREDSYKDIKALFDWLKVQKSFALDSNRVMVSGGSYGGFMTLAVATNYPEYIRCAQDIVGPSNLVSFLERTEDYRKDLRRVEYGDERNPEIRAFLEKIAPRNKVDKIKTPLFVVQGKNDPRVPWKESEDMVAAARNLGTPVWYLMADDEGHGFRKKKNADFLFYSTVMFMKEHLLR